MAVLFDDAAPEVCFGGERIVRCAAQGQVGSEVLAASCERLEMVQVEIARLAAALTALVDEAAAARVAYEYRAFHCGRNGSAALTR